MDKNIKVTLEDIKLSANDDADFPMSNDACKTMQGFSMQLRTKTASADKYPYAFQMKSKIESGATFSELENWLLNYWK